MQKESFFKTLKICLKAGWSQSALSSFAIFWPSRDTYFAIYGGSVNTKSTLSDETCESTCIQSPCTTLLAACTLFMSLLPSILSLLTLNIFFPFVRRVGVLFFTSRGSGTKRRAGGQRRNAAQRRVAGCERRRGECQNAFVLVLARKRRLDLATVRAVAERRPPERSGVKGRR